MTKKTHITGAVALLLFAIILLGATIHLAYVFPHTVVRWADEGRELSTLQQSLVNTSHFFRVYGLFILAAIVGMIAASIVWITVALAGNGGTRPSRVS